MTDTPNLGLPYIDAAQAQKHVTHNEALRILDAAIQIAVQDTTRSAPPASPVEGTRHVVATGASGAWAGHVDAIASWQDGAWSFLAPKPGWCAWSVADDGMLVFDGAGWRTTGAPVLDSVPHLGINGAADASNRLSVTSNAALFAATDMAHGGSGDVRLQLSKESVGRTASVVFSDGYSGRAEFGLVGSDAFKLKVSADGASWAEALVVDQASGHLAVAHGFALTGICAPAVLAASQDNYNPAGLAAASVLQISSDASRSLSGIAGGSEGRMLTVVNVGGQSLTLLDDSASSIAANRFAFGGTIVLAARRAAVLRYDGTAARWQLIAGGGASDTERQNRLLNGIYLAKALAAPRRAVLEYYDGFKSADGIASITGGTVNTAGGYLSPNAGVTTSSAAPTNTAPGLAGLTMMDRSWTLTNGATYERIGAYITTAKTIVMKILLRNAAGNYSVVASQSFSHPGGGWADVALAVPYSVPATGSYHVGGYVASGAWDYQTSAPLAYLSGDQLGTAGGYTESAAGTTPSFRATTLSISLATTEQHVVPSTVGGLRVLLEYEKSGAIVLNTDLAVEVSCDGGANWASAGLLPVVSGQPGRELAETPVQACIPGSSLVARMKSTAGRILSVRGIAMTVI